MLALIKINFAAGKKMIVLKEETIGKKYECSYGDQRMGIIDMLSIL